MLPRPPPVVMDSSTESVAEETGQDPGSSTVAVQHAGNPLLLGPIPEGDGRTFQPPEAGGHTSPPQMGDDLVAGTHVMGANPSAMDMPGASAIEAAEDVNAALGPDLAFVFDDELGDGSIGIHDNVENTFVENNIAEEVVDRHPTEMGEGACRCGVRACVRLVLDICGVR